MEAVHQKLIQIGQMIEILDSCKEMPEAPAKAMIEMACDIFGKNFVLNVMRDFGFSQFYEYAR